MGKELVGVVLVVVTGCALGQSAERAHSSASGRAAYLLAVGNDEAALHTVEQALRDRPDNIPLRVLKARSLWRLGEKDAAIAIARAVLRRAPRQRDMYFLVARYYHNRIPELAIIALNQYLTERPPRLSHLDGAIHVNIGVEYLLLRRFEDGVRAFDAAHALSKPGTRVHARAIAGMCAAHVALHAYERAIGCCEQILGSDHDSNRSAHFNVARAYFELGRFEEALPQVEVFVTARPDSERGRRLRSQILDALEREGAAREPPP